MKAPLADLAPSPSGDGSPRAAWPSPEAAARLALVARRAPAHALRVALITDSADPSGVGCHMLALAGALSPDVAPTLAFGRSPAALAFVDRARREGLRAQGVGDWAAFLDRLRPDVVHVHAGIGWEGLALVHLAADRAIPVVRTEHLPWLVTDPRQAADYAACVASVDALVAVSRAAGATWAQALRHMPGPRRPLCVIPNGVAEPEAPRRPVARWRAPRAPLLLCVARLTPQKGHRVLLAAFARLLREMPAARLQIVGSGPEEGAIRARIGRLGLGDRAELMGPRDDVPALMARATAVVLPSLFEGLPLVVLEAMAMRLPVVASRIGGVEEALGADHPWLVPPGDCRALARALADAVRDSARDAVAARARARWEGRFTARVMAARTAAIYRSVAGQAGMGDAARPGRGRVGKD